MEKVEPPAYLSEDSKLHWGKVVEQATIDAAAYPILVMFFEARDARRVALDEIAVNGRVGKDRFGMLKPSPWCAIERDQALIMIRAYKSLGFDQALPQPGLFS